MLETGRASRCTVDPDLGGPQGTTGPWEQQCARGCQPWVRPPPGHRRGAGPEHREQSPCPEPGAPGPAAGGLSPP